MADFRRVVTALAVVVLLMGFASTASAQVTAPFTCTASVVPTLIRAEGLTEMTGDIVIRCTGGANITGDTVIPTANFQVFLGNTTVTSRLISALGASNASEALLLIDEPTTTLNPGGTFQYSTSALTGCAATPAACIASGTVPNVYFGLVSGNSVEFRGVPINPPGTTTGVNAERIFRITNVRANATTVGAGPAGTPGQVQAYVTVTGSTAVPISNQTPIVGFVQNGMLGGSGTLRSSDGSAALGTAGISLRQCTAYTRDSPVGARLRFTEGFASSFKIKGHNDGLDFVPQTVPGNIYNTESGLVIGPTGVTSIGLASFGTRLRATFANIPQGVAIWVGLTNAGGVANAAPYAVLTSSETGAFSAVTGTGGYGQVSLTAGAGTAVWEIRASSPLATETFDFDIRFVATPSVTSNLPAPGVTGTVAGSFAPAPPAFSAAAGALASSTLPIPRFIDTGVARNLVVVNICRTVLLFPFVTNQATFDTGLAISNTTQDPFGIAAQTGTCTWNFYGANAPAAVTTAAAVPAGTTTVLLASSSAPNFQGYVIAVCNFQFAHGFAFVSDIGAQDVAMGYLALVLPESGRAADEMLDN